MKTLISVVGTTGIGKTSLAVALAKFLDTEIISCDSRQFFREMKIGTAAPSATELQEAKHYFIGNLSVTDYYSIGQFEADAEKKLQEIFTEKNFAVLVGGSMMYEKAVIKGLNNLPEANADNRNKLRQVFEEKGIGGLQDILGNIDADYYEVVDRQNPRRLFRAIDVIWQTGRKYSELIAEPEGQKDFRTVRIGIEAPREIIYERINRRVDLMMENGLLQEVEKLLPHRELVSLKTVGYTELFHYLDGKWDLDFAVEEIKKNSRRFAKRQLTWYRKEDDIHWVNYENAFTESLSLLQDLNIKLKN